MDDMEADPATAATQPTAGTKLCIAVAPDGALSVYKDAGDGAGEQTAQPAADIGAALKMVLDMFKGLGQPGADQAFDDGFGGQQEQPGAGGTNTARRQGMMQ